MSLGKLYVFGTPRVNSAKALIAYYKLPVEIVDTQGAEEFQKEFPMKQVPSFMGSDGYKLTETPAILHYLVGQLPEADRVRLEGSTLKEQCQVQRWVSVANTGSFTEAVNPTFSLMGFMPYDKKSCDAHIQKLHQYAAYFDSELAGREYLAADHFTLADLHCLAVWTMAFSALFGTECRAKYPNLVAWFNRAIANPIAATVYADFKMTDKPLPEPAQ